MSRKTSIIIGRYGFKTPKKFESQTSRYRPWLCVCICTFACVGNVYTFGSGSFTFIKRVPVFRLLVDSALIWGPKDRMPSTTKGV